MKRKIKARGWLGVVTGVLIGLFTGVLLSSGEPVVGAASSASQAQNRQMNQELKKDLLIDIDVNSDKVVSRIVFLEKQLISLSQKVATNEGISARIKDLQALGRRHAKAEAKWDREIDKLKGRLRVNEDALKKLCARPRQAGRISRPGIPKTLLGYACDGYEPAR